MPLTRKGETILTSMKHEYGAKRGTGVFYASINKGRVKGAEKTVPLRPRKAMKP